MMDHRTIMGFQRDEAIRQRRIDRVVMRRVWTYIKPYRRPLIAFVVAVVLGSIATAVTPLLLKVLIDEAVPHGDRRLVMWVALGAVGLALFNGVVSLAQRYYSARIGEGLIYDLRVKLFDHVQGMPIAFFTRTQTGALQSRLNNDVVGAQQAVTNTLGTVLQNVIQLIVTLAIMFKLSPPITLLTLVALPAFIYPARLLGPRIQKLARVGMQENAAMNNITAERFNVAGAMLAKLFGRPDREVDEFASRAGRVRDVGVTTAVYSRILLVALGLVTALGTAIVYWIGGNLAVSHTITVGDLAAFTAYVALIYQPLAQLTNSRVDVLTALVSFERVFEVIDFPAAISDRPGAVDLVDPKGRIELDHVWFRHPAGREVSLESLEAPNTPGAEEPSDWTLRDVSLVIEPGATVALVGASGAGKTTIAMLVPRVADVVEGSVRIDGHDVPRPDARVAARGHGSRAPGSAPLPRHDPRQPPLRPGGSHRRRPPRGTRAGPDLGPRRVAPGRPRHGGRRARVPDVGRREAAPGDRAAPAEEPGDRDPRRGDLPPRLRVGAGDPACVRRGPARPHRDRHCPPALHDRRRRPHRRGRCRKDRRVGHAHRAPRPRGNLRRALPRPIGTFRRCGEDRVGVAGCGQLPSLRPAMTRTPPSETSDPDAKTRRARLESRRRRRTQLIVGAVIVAVAGIGGAVAYAMNSGGTDAHAAPQSGPDASTFGAEGTLVPTPAATVPPTRTLDHAHPLKLWIGGDSLAGSFGPALGDQVGATGVVSSVLDYKTSSGLYSNDIRNWYQRASEQMTSVNPDAVVFIIGTNDASIVNNVDSNGDLVPDWEASYRLKIDRMMDLLVGPNHRTVFWLGPPTLGPSDLDPGGKALGELMREEALKRSPDVTYLDAYKLFSNLDGGYSRTILDENGGQITARIPDGVHFTEAGAQYLARAVFSLIDARWQLTKQADLLHPIGWTNAPGSGEVVPGRTSKPRSRYQSGSNGSSNNNSSNNNSSNNNSSNNNSSETTVSSTSMPQNVSVTTAATTPSSSAPPTTGAKPTTPPTTTASKTVTTAKP